MRNSTLVLGVLVAVLGGCDPEGTSGVDGGGMPDGATCSGKLPVVHVSSSVTMPTVWQACTVYAVEASFVISAQLTIEPGAIVKLTKGPAITFSQGGKVVAMGTETAPVVFTSIKDDSHGGDSNDDGSASSPAPGDWNAIKISGPGSVVSGCHVMYGGGNKPYAGALSVINDSPATIKDCMFAHNAGGTLEDTRAAALHVGGATAATVVTGNMFFDNDLPLVINGLFPLDDSNVFHMQPPGGAVVRNGLNGIFLDSVNHTVTAAVTWSNTDAPYVLDETVLSIADGGTLTLGNNVIVKSWKGRIDVANLGTLTQGTGDAFTSLRDDTRLGDSNGDGATTVPAAGDWTGVKLCKPNCTSATWGNIYYDTK